MESNELRIGNLITARYQDDYAVNQVVVNAVSEIGVNRLYGETEFYIENCEPIPLTEDWLVKMGFIKYDTDTYDKGDYTFRLDRFNLWDYTGDESYLIAINIKHVHQLQNLYFALTGEELVIK